MSNRPHFSSGERLAAEKIDRVSERAYHSHVSASGIDGPGGMSMSAEPKRREWEWAKLQAELTYDSEASARLYRDPDKLAIYTTLDVKAPPAWYTNEQIASGEWVRVERHTPGVWYVVTLPLRLIPIELKADLALFGSANAYHLDNDGVRTTREETVYDILGFYEGVGSAGSGVDDKGDKGWVTRLSDGKLKVVALSCEPPGNAP